MDQMGPMGRTKWANWAGQWAQRARPKWTRPKWTQMGPTQMGPMGRTQNDEYEN